MFIFIVDAVRHTSNRLHLTILVFYVVSALGVISLLPSYNTLRYLYLSKYCYSLYSSLPICRRLSGVWWYCYAIHCWSLCFTSVLSQAYIYICFALNYMRFALAFSVWAFNKNTFVINYSYHSIYFFLFFLHVFNVHVGLFMSLSLVCSASSSGKDLQVYYPAATWHHLWARSNADVGFVLH